MMNVIIIGPPGAGKGTQAEIICKELDLAHVSSGDLLRGEVKAKSKLGLEAEGYMKAGELVPDQLMINMILNKVKGLKSEGKGFMLDGFPRNIEQAKALDASFKEESIEVSSLIALVVGSEEIVERLTSRRVCPVSNKIYNTREADVANCNCCDESVALIKRKDDEEDVIRQRLRVYTESTEPILGYYREKHELLEIDGSQEKDTITALILKALKSE